MVCLVSASCDTRVDNTHPDKLAQTFHLRVATTDTGFARAYHSFLLD